ncbi:MAG: hypothetical protein ACYTBJ_06445 [Planctomycetota bacterium]|jgi:hypothetical protein
MKDKSQLLESIDRFSNGFWSKKTSDRPPIGIAPASIWNPIDYLRVDYSRPELCPEDVDTEFFITDYENGFLNRTVLSDDWMPFNAPWRAIPWLEAICGCPVRSASGSLAAGHYISSLSELEEITLPVKKEWIECLIRQIQILVDNAPADCWISPTILRGPSDVLGAMCGLTEFYCDLLDKPSVLDRVAGQINQVFLHTLDIHLSLVGPKHGGYGHIYGYWAPHKTLVIQEDAMGMCPPKIYRDMFLKYNRDIVNYLGDYVLFHLHSTGYEHYRHVLEIDGIGGLELTMESNGPALQDIIPDLKHILQRSRLILFADHYFEQLPDVLKKVPHEGLYLIIPDKYISTEKDFAGFIKDNF